MSNEKRDTSITDPHTASVQYHENHVIGILDTLRLAKRPSMR
jgi:hypothetical protein